MRNRIATCACFVGVWVAAGCGDDDASESDVTEVPPSLVTTTSALPVPSDSEPRDGSRVDELSLIHI